MVLNSFKSFIKEAEDKKVAIGHFNISDLAQLKAIFEAAKELGLPVVIGTSEGEREFIGTRQAAVLIKSLREEFDYPIFLNADHTHSLEKAVEAAEAGYDAVLFDGAGIKLSFEENIRQTKEVVKRLKDINPDILIEGELGYIGGSSKILKEIPKDAAITPELMTKPEESVQFVKETCVDLLAPAVGNIHGMFKNASNPNLDIERIGNIRQAAGIPLVLHGGSGIKDEQFTRAIKAGISIIHISTELRLAWREGLEKSLRDNPEEVAPYKIMEPVIREIKNVVEKRMRLFNGL